MWQALDSFDRRFHISRVAGLSFLLALAGTVVAVGAGPGHRLGLYDVQTAMELVPVSDRWLFWALYAAAGALALAMIVNARAGRFVQAMLAIGLAAATLAIKIQIGAQAALYPPINDVTTNLSDPPAFVALNMGKDGPPMVATRGRDELAGLDPSEQHARWHREAYGDLAPLRLPLDVEEATTLANKVATEMGWDVVHIAPGHLEAIAETSWVGFKDDVAVRIRGVPGGAQVDVRSVSRIQIPGVGDVGENAKRIRAFLRAMRAG